MRQAVNHLSGRSALAVRDVEEEASLPLLDLEALEGELGRSRPLLGNHDQA